MTHTSYTKAVISQKLEDRFLTTQVIEPEAGDAQMGTLFALLEISRPWYPNAQIGQTIVNTLKREYYLQKSTSDLENFEQAIKKVNETLARITEAGETDWIGNLSSVITLKVGSQVHITSTGLARGYLLRRGNLSEITESDVRSEEPHPLATFSSIVSGEIQPADVMFLASPGVFEYFDKATLRDLLAEETPYQATTNLVKRLPRATARSVNFLVIAETIKPAEELPKVLYLDEPLTTSAAAIKDYVQKSILPTLAAAADAAGRGLAQLLHLTRTKVLPESKKLAAQAMAQARTQGTKVRQILQQQLAKTSKQEEKPSLIGKHIFTVHDYQVKARKSSDIALGKFLPKLSVPRLGVAASARRWASLPNTFLALGITLLNRFKGLVSDWRRGEHRFSALLVAAVTLALLLIVSIAVQKNRSTGKRRFQEQGQRLAEAKRATEEGKTALIFGQQAQALKLFAQATEDARFATSHPKLQEEAQAVLDETLAQLDKLTATTRFKDLKPVMEVGSLKGMVEFDGKLWGFRDAGALYAANLLEGQVEKVAEPQGVEVVATTRDGDKLIGLTSEGKLVVANLKERSVKVLSGIGDASLRKGRDINTFAGNLYLLDPEGNQIWRYPIKDEGFEAGAGFFKKGPGLAKAQSMAIDGSIYVLEEGGKVGKYLKGEKQGFDLATAPKPDEQLSAANKIFADTDSLSIFIVDNQKDRPRLVEFGKDGKYLHQYVFNLPSIDEIYLTNRGRKAWILSGGKLYEVNL